MINNTSRQRWERVRAKSLDQQFLQEMMDGLQCSRFEAQAILDKAHEVFAPLLSNPGSLHPGQVQVSVLDAATPAKVPLRKARQRLVTLTLSQAEDHTIRQQEGVAGVRRCRLMRMAEEAFQQGGVLTLEDLAALLNCGVRTLSRDLQLLRREGLVPPLRSLIQDMGRALTHRREIVSLWLQGLEYSEIAHRSRHSVDSVANYVEKFKRCGSLFVQAFDLHTVAFLVGISPALAAEYHHLWSEATPVAHRRRELEQWSQKNDFPSAATLREP